MLRDTALVRHTHAMRHLHKSVRGYDSVFPASSTSCVNECPEIILATFLQIERWVNTVLTVIIFSAFLTFKRRIKSRMQFASIIRSSPYSPRFQDKG